MILLQAIPFSQGNAYATLTYIIAAALAADGATLQSITCLNSQVKAYASYAYHPATFHAYDLLMADEATIASLTCLDNQIKAAT